ncbi:MAG: carbamate kinase [archaeon GB-1867-005]|nr:carbamate kinase [Candidatus Culexmicrobium cathedralense]
MTKRVLVALGGNAIKKADEIGTAEEQLRNVRKTCKNLIQLVKMGYQLIITHGNGPQVGNLMIQQEEAEDRVPPQPLDILGAMTQGQIGYMLQQTLQNMLRAEGIGKPVVTVVTQVLVDKNDPAFNNPTKPVGPFYNKDEAEKIARNKGYIIKKIKPGEGRVYRRVVPSPDPIKVIEGDAIRAMVEEGMIVIATGGGGIPVVEEHGELKGVEAVIDKDLASEKLAEVVKADILLILTDIDKVRLNYGKPNEKPLDKMTLEEAKKYYSEGHFLPGSMGPKVLACIRFLEWGGEKAIIADLERAVEAIKGEAGTLIYRGS